MADPDLQRKLSAIMFTDIVGYSKMMEKDETATLSYLKFHKLLIYLEVEKHAGRVIKTVGDAFLADFPSAVNAVKCAATIQRRLQEHNRTTGEDRQVRIGIHVGDVIIADNDIFGDGVNIAARLQAIAEPGGICISEDVYHHIKHLSEYKPVSLGPKELKNVSHKVEAYKISPESLKKLKHAQPQKSSGMAFAGFLLLLGLAVWVAARWYFSEYPGGQTESPAVPARVIPVPTAASLPTQVPTPTEALPTFTETPVPTPTATPKPRLHAKVKKKAKVRRKAGKIIAHKALKPSNDYVEPETVGIVPVVEESAAPPELTPVIPTPSGELPPPP